MRSKSHQRKNQMKKLNSLNQIVLLILKKTRKIRVLMSICGFWLGRTSKKISSNVWVSTSVHQQNQFPSRMMSQCQHCQTLRNLTWLRKKVKTHSSIGIAFSSSSLFCDSRIDLCRWSYVKLFGLYMHHDSEVSSHGSRGRRILDSSIMLKNL